MPQSTQRVSAVTWYFACFCAWFLCLGGCEKASEVPAADQSTAQAGPASAAVLPPSFLDEAPAAPLSSTIILSGGTLVADSASRDNDLFDAVIVISEGKVVATGKRGAVSVPADSIGIDTSGKFIIAEPSQDSAESAVANFTIYNERPTPEGQASIFAQVTDGVWVLVDPSGKS